MASGNCSAPPSIFAGSVSYTNTTAVYSCSTGYTMNGYPEINCIGNEWNGTRPSCSYLIVPNATVYENVINVVKDIAPTWFLVLFAVVSCVAGISMFILMTVCCMHLCRLCSFPFTRHGGKYVYPENIGCCCNACKRRTAHRNLDKATGKGKRELKSRVDQIVVTKKVAKEIDGWRPHAKAIRDINTSTQ